MKSSTARQAVSALAGIAILSILPTVLAHGDDEGGMGMGHGHEDGGAMPQPQPEDDGSAPLTYFSYPDHQAVLYLHISLMIVSWVLILPVAVMFSLARSRYAVGTQLVFTLANGAGVLFGFIFNHSTPDLYPNNAHHRLGWVVTWLLLGQVVVGILARLAGAFNNNNRRKAPTPLPLAGGAEERQAFMPVSTAAMAAHHQQHHGTTGRIPAGAGGTAAGQGPYRFSNDSGQGTERNTASLRSSQSSSPSRTDEEAAIAIPMRDVRRKEEDVDVPLHGHDDDDREEDEIDHFDDEFLGGGGANGTGVPKLGGAQARGVLEKAAGYIKSPRAWRVLVFGYNFVDRTSLILGFMAICTGIITHGRLFEGREIFSGLAHWIKGGVFFWLGVLTVGRWCGAFAELGWAWNVRPRSSSSKQQQQKWRPSAEWAESFTIFFYGSTNIFLEHLGGWGGVWTPQDMEHISITVLFIGGGMVGMLVESARIRDLLNFTVMDNARLAQQQRPSGPFHRHHDRNGSDDHHGVRRQHMEGDDEDEAMRPPKQYGVSLNPIPALVILLLGIMMSSHTQTNMVSAMVHKQWGNLLMGGAFARGFSYVLMWLKPPRSILPSRPPTELLAAFGLMAGGIIFMASSGDTVAGMVHYDLDAMFIYTVTMGLVALLMAWIVALMALKGWAGRREAAGRRMVASYQRL